MKTTKLSPYKIYWIEFRAIKGFITKHDQLIFGATIYGVMPKKHKFYKYLGSKDLAQKYLTNDFSKLNKPYECRIFTDKQFSLAKDNVIPFTKKQNDGMVIINNK